MSSNKHKECDRENDSDSVATAVASIVQIKDPQLSMDAMMGYLEKQNSDMTVLIVHAKLALKSYAQEKRFICPPACIYLLGDGWTAKEGQLPTDTQVCSYVGTGGERKMQKLDFEGKNFCVAKKVYVRKSDERTYVKLIFQLSYSTGHPIGTFHSRQIKVISKIPSKKLSLKNPDLPIASGTKIAIFSRHPGRSETRITRYLRVTNQTFHASSTQWGTLTIHLLDENEPESEEFISKEGYIHYGATVKLVCTVTGMALPQLIIRKVDKQTALLNADRDDLVSQFQKCAFYMKDTERMYLCLTAERERITVVQAAVCPRESDREMITEETGWAMVGVDQAQYRFYKGLGHTSIPVSPVPVVRSLNLNGGGGAAMVELIGENFTPLLRVWFHNVKAKTMFRCEELLLCVVPEMRAFSNMWDYSNMPVQPLKVPITLVRNVDGMIYPTGRSYTYRS